jgi:hypothetical protein
MVRCRLNIFITLISISCVQFIKPPSQGSHRLSDSPTADDGVVFNDLDVKPLSQGSQRLSDSPTADDGVMFNVVKVTRDFPVQNQFQFEDFA